MGKKEVVGVGALIVGVAVAVKSADSLSGDKAKCQTFPVNTKSGESVPLNICVDPNGKGIELVPGKGYDVGFSLRDDAEKCVVRKVPEETLRVSTPVHFVVCERPNSVPGVAQTFSE